jgi:hypothetical protein
MHRRRSLVATLIVIGLLPGCGSDDSKTSDVAKAPSAAELKQQLFQGSPLGFKTSTPVVVITDPDEYADSSEGWWSPEDDRAKARSDSLKLFKQAGLEGGASLRYVAKDDARVRGHFIIGEVMAVRNAKETAADVADRVKAMATHPCEWACVKQSAPLKLPADSGAVGYSVLREVRPGGTAQSARDQRQVYVTWSNGRYVHLALLFDLPDGPNVKAFTRLIVDETRRTAAA